MRAIMLRSPTKKRLIELGNLTSDTNGVNFMDSRLRPFIVLIIGPNLEFTQRTEKKADL